jgi:hypothetical protein
LADGLDESACESEMGCGLDVSVDRWYTPFLHV